MNSLKCGDVVKLKSGSPAMTVEEIGKYSYSEKDRAKCIWFDGMKKCDGIFELDTLEIFEKMNK